MICYDFLSLLEDWSWRSFQIVTRPIRSRDQIWKPTLSDCRKWQIPSWLKMLNVPVANHRYFGILRRFGIPEFSLFGALSALPFWLGVDRPSLSVVEAVSGFLGWLLVSDWLDWGVADWSIFFSGGIRNIEILIFVARGKSLFLFKKVLMKNIWANENSLFI